MASSLAQHDFNDQQHQRFVDDDKHSTTTWIPILEYNKEQGEDGSYKTS